MLDAMRQLALEYLHGQLGGTADQSPAAFYRHLRATAPQLLFPYLVENANDEGAATDKKRYYTLAPAADDAQVAVLEAFELTESAARNLPFNKPTGPLSAALGPLIKRSAPGLGKPAGPSRRVQGTTLQSFQAIAKSQQPWSVYFAAARECWMRPRLRRGAATMEAPGGALAATVAMIGEKYTVLLAYQTADGRLPGEVPEYAAFLQQVLATTKYTTESAAAQPGQTCPLCNQGPVLLYPNALRGAGINFANVDRGGAFPGLDQGVAWKSFGLCVECADALYVYWHHVADKFLMRIAGEKVLAVPSIGRAAATGQRFLPRMPAEAGAATQATDIEPPLRRFLGEADAVSSLTLLWAEFGQRIDDVRGVVTGIQPARLKHLQAENEAFNRLQLPLFPEVALEEFSIDLPLSLLRPLFHRPGGAKAKAYNESRRLFDLRRDIADALYHGQMLPQERFWHEVLVTARWRWRAALDAERPTLELLHEGWPVGEQSGFITAAGWVRQLARFLHYCRTVGCYPPPQSAGLYRPGCEILRPFCGPSSGIDSLAKAFAFVLGILYGKLLRILVARHSNVRPQALAWPRRLTLAGKDLPQLFEKVGEHLLARDGSPDVRGVAAELAEIGQRIGGPIDLDEAQVGYFLLLGQSVAAQVLPSNREKGNDDA